MNGCFKVTEDFEFLFEADFWHNLVLVCGLFGWFEWHDKLPTCHRTNGLDDDIVRKTDDDLALNSNLMKIAIQSKINKSINKHYLT